MIDEFARAPISKIECIEIGIAGQRILDGTVTLIRNLQAK